MTVAELRDRPAGPSPWRPDAGSVIPSAARDLARMSRARCYYVYILSSRSGVLYVGSTSNLIRRVYQHVHGLIPGFTAAYRVHRLMWWESTPNARAAVAREREIKSWRRERKVALIEGANAGWRDLAVDWFPGSCRQDPSLRSG